MIDEQIHVVGWLVTHVRTLFLPSLPRIAGLPHETLLRSMTRSTTSAANPLVNSVLNLTYFVNLVITTGWHCCKRHSPCIRRATN